MPEQIVLVGSADPITAGEDAEQLQLVPLETGQEVADLTETGDWQNVPLTAESFPAGYYCVFERTGTRAKHAGHVRIVTR